MKKETQYNLGDKLDKNIYKEGENTWGCKNGWLDVEDVKLFIRELKDVFCECEEIKGVCVFCNVIDYKAGKKLYEK